MVARLVLDAIFTLALTQGGKASEAASPPPRALFEPELRVLHETAVPEGTTYDFELVTRDRDGTELVARARVTLADDDRGQTKVVALETPDKVAFDVPRPFNPRLVGNTRVGDGAAEIELPKPLVRGPAAGPARETKYPIPIY